MSEPAVSNLMLPVFFIPFDIISFDFISPGGLFHYFTLTLPNRQTGFYQPNPCM